jgi:hypothetical protein
MMAGHSWAHHVVMKIFEKSLVILPKQMQNQMMENL